MSTDKGNTQQGRRRFLKGVMAVGGTTVLVAVGREAFVDDETQTVAAQPVQPPETERNYRLTSHIQRYYEKARF